MGTGGREGGRIGVAGLFGGTAHTRTQVIWKGIGTSEHRHIAAHRTHPASSMRPCPASASFCRQAARIHDRDARKRKKKKTVTRNPNPNPGRLNQQSPTTTTTLVEQYQLGLLLSYTYVVGTLARFSRTMHTMHTVATQQQYYLVLYHYSRVCILASSIMHTLQQSIRKYLFIYILLATVVYFYIILYSRRT